MKIAKVLSMVAVLCIVANAGAIAAPYLRGDGLTLVWVKVKARPGEGRWQACRRVYQHDVYHVRRGQGNVMWCHIEHHRLFDAGVYKRNFNLKRK